MMSTEEVWMDYRASLRAFLRSKVTNDADVEDLLQDILLKTHANLHTVRDHRSVKSWLMQIANRAIIDLYRSNRGLTEKLRDEGIWWDQHDVESAQDLAQCMRCFIRALPEDDVALLDAIDIQGRSQKEYAQSQGIAYSTMKSRVQRARRALRDVVLRCCQLSIDRRGKVIDFESRSGRSCTIC